ncbi:cysteine methyltransferase [Chromobacterium sp. LK11]|uniref:methylated-DNA--[protein]-cysteine S-methyltransferase n=1 Tax=Chromobacterium sp. LK11 TaxID=1628212 RepID=UPI000652BA26|nr:methylated-DNA--[protein]-cysteine S-methyltransferase [Chromobacterium sp. LK11]KMN76798.1 cysteine methyltransferase [Chromobacterium sp. LK11]
MEYSAVIDAPFGQLGMLCLDGALVNLEFLAARRALRPPAPRSLEQEVAEQLRAYFLDPRFGFSLPYRLLGSEHQLRVWREIERIPCGRMTRYQDIATALGSSARAVGNACGRNPVPIIVPCHRVVARRSLGGFNRSLGRETVDIKQWLLAHEFGC